MGRLVPPPVFYSALEAFYFSKGAKARVEIRASFPDNMRFSPLQNILDVQTYAIGNLPPPFTGNSALVSFTPKDTESNLLDH